MNFRTGESSNAVWSVRPLEPALKAQNKRIDTYTSQNQNALDARLREPLRSWKLAVATIFDALLTSPGESALIDTKADPSTSLPYFIRGRRVPALAGRLLCSVASASVFLTGIAVVAQDPPQSAGAAKVEKPADTGKPQSNTTDDRRVVLDELTKKGLPRKPPDMFLLRKQLPFQTPSNAQLKRFEELVRSGLSNDADRAVADLVIKYRILRLTDPGILPRFAAIRDELVKDLDNTRRIQPPLYELYITKLMDALPQLMENNIVVRVNAMIIMARQRYEPALAVMIAQVNNPDQHESVQNWAVNGIAALGELEIKNKALESEAVNALTKMLNRHKLPTPQAAIHPFTQRNIVIALGAVGRPMLSAVDRDAKVTQNLIEILRDPTINRTTRSEAARALARMRVPPDLDYNFQPIAIEIARFSVDAAYAAIVNPEIDNLRSHLFVYDCYDALVSLGGDPTSRDPRRKAGAAGVHPLAKAKRDAEFVAAIRDASKELTRILVDIYKPPPEIKLPDDLRPKIAEITNRLKNYGAEKAATDLLKFIKARAPRDWKLTPTMEPLKPGSDPKLPEPPKAEETKKADEEKKADSGPATDSQ